MGGDRLLPAMPGHVTAGGHDTRGKRNRRALHTGALLGLLAPGAAHAHPGEPLRPHDLWAAWTLDPWIVIPLYLLAAVYAIGASRVWRRAGRARGIGRGAAVAFAASMVTLLVALISPLHELSGALFSAHMAQHELLMLIAAPLLVLAAPDLAVLWAFPHRTRSRVVRLAATAGLTRAWEIVTEPWVAWSLHAVLIWGWHAPAPFDATLRSDAVHALQHASFFGTGFIFWWSLLRGRRRRSRHAVALISLFTTALHTTVLGVLLTVASEPWYAAYGSSTAPWGLSPIEDQQLGGLIMWVPGGMVYAAAAIGFLGLLLRDPRARRHGVRPPVRAPAARVAGALLLLVIGCREHTPEADARGLTGGDPAVGARAIRTYGCASCHVIPGIRGAVGQVGPPLSGIANRHFIAGVLPNNPDNMVRWIEDPPKVDSLTAMPRLGISRETARDIAAYLYTLR